MSTPGCPRLQHSTIFRLGRGITLVELMVTLTITTILLAVAAPSLVQFMNSSALSGLANEMMSSLNYARSEAIKRGQAVSLCASSNGSSCSGSWISGWILFNDSNGDGSVDMGDSLLRVRDAATSTGYTMQGTANTITYGRNGLATATGKIVICYNSDESQARLIEVTLNRPRFGTLTGSATCESP